MTVFAPDIQEAIEGLTAVVTDAEAEASRLAAGTWPTWALGYYAAAAAELRLLAGEARRMQAEALAAWQPRGSAS